MIMMSNDPNDLNTLQSENWSNVQDQTYPVRPNL